MRSRKYFRLNKRFYMFPQKLSFLNEKILKILNALPEMQGSGIFPKSVGHMFKDMSPTDFGKIPDTCISGNTFRIFRSSRTEVFCKKGVLKILQNSQKNTCTRFHLFSSIF